MFGEELTHAVDALFNIQVDLPDDLDEQELQADQVEWYLNRFTQFRKDGVPEAIPLYIRHLSKNKAVNERTHLYILQHSIEE